jgi:peptide-methionine (R)-S-oxide reductase
MATYIKSSDVIANLNKEQFFVTQQSGTERSGTGALLH